MNLLVVACFLVGYYPLALAWRGSRHTSLLQAVNWAIAAWTAWLLGHGVPLGGDPAGIDAPRYLALCLTGCTAVAILGARRPHVGVWNFVVLGLLAVMILPLIERLVIGAQSLDPLRLLFLTATIAVGVLNYLPTVFVPGAMFFAMGCTGEMLILIDESWKRSLEVPAALCLAIIPWAAWWGWSRQRASSAEFNRLWLDFRNRYGLVWAQRVREQFNCSAVHAGWPVILYWQGLVRVAHAALPDPEMQKEMLETLKAILKRFITVDDTKPQDSAPAV